MENHPPSRTDEPDKTGLGGKLKRYLFGLAILASLVAAGCTQGSYPVDIFYEMHYQQYYKSGEPPSLSAPAGSVAWFPPPQPTAFDDGSHLFTVNCSMCHGVDAKGSASPQGPGPVLRTLTDQYGYQEHAPTDLTLFTADFIQTVVEFTSQPDRLRFFGDTSIMPPFGKLLSAKEIRDIAEYIATLPSTTPVPTVGEQPTPTPIPAPSPTPTVSTDEETPALPPSLEIGVNGEALEFDKDRFEVPIGSEVVLVFNNVSSLNQHNWVIVQAGQKDAVAVRGTVAGPGNDWIQPEDPDVIAQTALLNPGESGEVRFAAPPPGTYQFVCTFPGHNTTMFGEFVVNP